MTFIEPPEVQTWGTSSRDQWNRGRRVPRTRSALAAAGTEHGHLPRVLDPTGRRWSHVWADRAAAQAFADELNEQTVNEGWEVEGRPSEGPLG